MFARTLFVLVIGLGALTDALASETAEPAEQADAATADVIEIIVDDGYHPDRIVVKEGQTVRLKFIRNEHTSCTREVVFPTLGIRRPLPTGEPVVIDLGTPATGEIEFHCGMEMIHGLIVIEPKE